MSTPGSTSSLNEAQARYVLIDPALDKAGWKLHDRTQVGLFRIVLWSGAFDYLPCHSFAHLPKKNGIRNVTKQKLLDF